MSSKHKNLHRPISYAKTKKSGAKTKMGKRIPWFTVGVTGKVHHGSHSAARRAVISALLDEGYTRITPKSFQKDGGRVLLLSRR